MPTRTQLIEGILHGLHALRNQIKAKAVHLGHHHGIAHSQWFVLKILEHSGERSVKDIAETLGISSSAATQLVEGLVRRGYVTRREDPKDRRSVRLTLSPKGKKHLAATNDQRVTEMAGIFDALTDRELEEYLRLHGKILARFTQKKES